MSNFQFKFAWVMFSLLLLFCNFPENIMGYDKSILKAETEWGLERFCRNNKRWEITPLGVTDTLRNRHATTETRVAYDNSTWHAINTEYIHSSKETCARWNHRRRLGGSLLLCACSMCQSRQFSVRAQLLPIVRWFSVLSHFTQIYLFRLTFHGDNSYLFMNNNWFASFICRAKCFSSKVDSTITQRKKELKKYDCTGV